MSDLGAAYLADVRARFAQYRRLAEDALAQVDDHAFFARLGGAGPEGENTLALVVKHLAGNFRSRWTDFLTSDLEKPDRRRDAEFEVEPDDSREALMARWADGWAACEATLAALTPADLLRTVTIRSEPTTALGAIGRGLTHAAYHVGQIVLLAKHHAGPRWRSLSIPRGASEAFAAALRTRHEPAP